MEKNTIEVESKQQQQQQDNNYVTVIPVEYPRNRVFNNQNAPEYLEQYNR